MLRNSFLLLLMASDTILRTTAGSTTDESNNEKVNIITTSSTSDYSTTFAMSIASTSAPCNSNTFNSTILNTLCCHLKICSDLYIGIGAAGTVVIVALVVALIAVCCDRKCRKTKSPPSAYSPIGTENIGKQENQGDGRGVYNNDSATVCLNRKTEPGDGPVPAPLYEEADTSQATYALAHAIPGEGGVSKPAAYDENAYAEASTVNRFHPDQSTPEGRASINSNTYADTATVKQDQAPAGHEEHPNWEINMYEGALAVQIAKLNQIADVGFLDSTVTGIEGADGLDDLPELDEEITLVDNNIYCNSAGINPPINNFPMSRQ